MPQREPIELMALCERLFEYYGLLAEHLDFRLEGENLTVPGDRLMLQRAIGNLLVNAINHTPPSGSVVLSLGEVDGQAVISIHNTGAAIPPEAIERIFDRFVRLDQGGEGSGLGLAITRSIVLAHGGSIDVTATGQQTEFRIRLPA
jgi:two-component system heavy metal sensor histidine kinase CusS